MIDAGDGPSDIYDVLTETFLAQNVTGPTAIDIPGNQAVSIVLAPAGGTITYDNNKMMINGVIVDYRQSAIAYNSPPRIQSFATQSNTCRKKIIPSLSMEKGSTRKRKTWSILFFYLMVPYQGLKTAQWTAPDQEGS
ncbi:MAG: hypothetical protein IPL92_13065 [Saprospiraceae bacterium]|nr:hypothetical protein [Candidatus Opimibacter iunctus]